MTDLTSVCFFFAYSRKRQQYFEKFIDFLKELFKVTETNRTHIIWLSNTRWVKRHKAYDNYFILYKFIVSSFESMVDKNMYSDFYAHLETEIKEKRFWDQESQSKIQGLSSSCRRFDWFVAFAVLCNGLEPLKPLVIKLQKRNQDIYHAYDMIDQIISDLKDAKRNIENEFKEWFKFATDMATSVGVDPEKPRPAKCCSRFRDNGTSTDSVRVTTVDQMLFL